MDDEQSKSIKTEECAKVVTGAREEKRLRWGRSRLEVRGLKVEALLGAEVGPCCRSRNRYRQV
jgi:hypothetical protein